jgi:hypothetical protein
MKTIITNSYKQWYCKRSYAEYNYYIYTNNVFIKALYRKSKRNVQTNGIWYLLSKIILFLTSDVYKSEYNLYYLFV